MSEQYKKWWVDKQDAGHRFRTEEWFERNAYELLCLVPHGGTLLDVGCGNAQLLTYFASNYDELIGIDPSSSMLDAAEKRINKFSLKNVRLELGDACQFPTSISHADVIISNQVVQFLDSAEVRIHLQQCNRVLAPNGVVGLCGIPWVNLRDWYLAGGIHGKFNEGIINILRTMRQHYNFSWKKQSGGVISDNLGNWHSREEITKIAALEGYDSHIVSAWYYEYRFHAKLSRRRKGTDNA